MFYIGTYENFPGRSSKLIITLANKKLIRNVSTPIEEEWADFNFDLLFEDEMLQT